MRPKMGRRDLAAPADRRNHGQGVRKTAISCAVAIALVLGVAHPQAATRKLGAFSGTGSWVSIYDHHALHHPAAVVATLRAHHIHTLFVETSNDKQRRGVAHPVAVAQLLAP